MGECFEHSKKIKNLGFYFFNRDEDYQIAEPIRRWTQLRRAKMTFNEGVHKEKEKRTTVEAAAAVSVPVSEAPTPPTPTPGVGVGAVPATTNSNN